MANHGKYAPAYEARPKPCGWLNLATIASNLHVSSERLDPLKQQASLLTPDAEGYVTLHHEGQEFRMIWAKIGPHPTWYADPIAMQEIFAKWLPPDMSEWLGTPAIASRQDLASTCLNTNVFWKALCKQAGHIEPDEKGVRLVPFTGDSGEKKLLAMRKHGKSYYIMPDSLEIILPYLPHSTGQAWVPTIVSAWFDLQGNQLPQDKAGNLLSDVALPGGEACATHRLQNPRQFLSEREVSARIPAALRPTHDALWPTLVPPSTKGRMDYDGSKEITHEGVHLRFREADGLDKASLKDYSALVASAHQRLAGGSSRSIATLQATPLPAPQYPHHPARPPAPRNYR